MIIDPKKVGEEAFYFYMIQAIIPRPIAWVLSKNPDGNYNVAPFSFFNGVTSEPPIIMLSVGWKDDTTRKDTWVNIDERNDFVVHIPPLKMAEGVVASSAPLPLNISEIDYAKLKTVPAEGASLPRLDGPKVAMFCVKHQILEIGREKQGLILGEIQKMWVADDCLTENKGRASIAPTGVDPLIRLGGKDYSGLGKIFSLNRPK